MKQWILAHINALIPLVLGIYMAVRVFFLPKHDTSSLDGGKKRQVFSVAGAGLVAIGIFRLFSDSIAEGQSRSVSGYDPAPRGLPANLQEVDPAGLQGPVIVTTDDGMASAEFPQIPERKEATDKEGSNVSRVSRVLLLDEGRMSFTLSDSRYVPGVEKIAPAQLFPEFAKGFQKLGFELTKTTELSDNMQEMIMDRREDGVRVVIRLWLGPGGIYRAIASLDKGYHDDPRAERFLSSFGGTAAANGK